MDFFYLDIETVPNDKELYLSLPEEGRKKLLNPIDSRIVAIGMKRKENEAQIFYGEDEKSILTQFWSALAESRKTNGSYQLVGFNIKDFDLPFLVTRSFIQEVKILPFVVKEVVDVRESLSAFKYGHTRGKLKEYGALMGLSIIDDIDGSRVAERYWAGEHAKIQEYLRKDLEITQAMHTRMKDLGITDILRW
ncbi:MAG: ribonuclease H-like domain-containing protein [Candidatus Diapherotrites archaeon]|nr:ribonuclease H-like domain-containing protein [Candidatus Diapherotrites archaeon]MDZ4256109.1 ribonuclease H-like domain-containing protein [archaeon]